MNIWQYIKGSCDGAHNVSIKNIFKNPESNYLSKLMLTPVYADEA